MYGISPLIEKFRVMWFSQRMSSSVLRTVVDRGRSRGCRQRPFSQPRPPLRGFGALLRSDVFARRRRGRRGPISDLCGPLDSAKRRFCPRGGAKAVKSVAVMKVRMLLRNRREAKLLFSANTFSTSLPVTTVTRGQNSDASPFDPTCAMCVFVGPGHASDATDSMASWNERRADARTRHWVRLVCRSGLPCLIIKERLADDKFREIFDCVSPTQAKKIRNKARDSRNLSSARCSL